MGHFVDEMVEEWVLGAFDIQDALWGDLEMGWVEVDVAYFFDRNFTRRENLPQLSW